MTRYAGTEAVVVGAASDIGLAIAKRLVEGGARVLLSAGTPQEHARLRRELGPAAQVMAPGAVDAQLASATDGVDLVFADTVAAVSSLAPYLRDAGAAVLTVPAPATTVPCPVAPSPTAPCSAAALPDAAHALAAALAGRGIRVNAVAASCIAAPSGTAVPLPPLGRLGAADEVARAALFLATEATFTTGARLPVDGGLGHA
ncbi:SDR family oxidoreductase [Streptomyces buecherae]|uniref:SDR family oxidoreductase n=2 Tax=Streptomyces buecherae TaxID=2763006 RepID=UPI00164D6F78|nr:SDR family oxidoreductase [Streptomyces buecherae]QNJ39924.1 SDR family oxidoreductase [Streptomyces buecherae]